MSVKYMYQNTEYATESEAQSAVVNTKLRLENNPTDWCVVKEIQSGSNGSWIVIPNELTDAQINDLDASKSYLIYSIHGSEHCMPLTSVGVEAKVAQYRTEYARWASVDKIIKFEVTDDDDLKISNVQEIVPSEDMSGYL